MTTTETDPGCPNCGSDDIAYDTDADDDRGGLVCGNCHAELVDAHDADGYSTGGFVMRSDA